MTEDEHDLDLEMLVATAGQTEVRRLEGDDLYLWAKLISELEHLQQRVNTVGKSLLVKHGCTDPSFILTDAGYILTQQEFGRLHNEAGTNGTG